MKINGTSKIEQESDKETLENQNEFANKTEDFASQFDKKNESDLVNVVKQAETFIDTEVSQQIEQSAYNKTILDSLKVRYKELYDKNGELITQGITKIKSLHPYVDRSINAIDVAISFLTNLKEDKVSSDVVLQTRSPAVFGFWVIILTFGVAFVWAIVAPLDSASHAIGKIILDSKKRIVQHPEGGVIMEILVREGDHVVKDQVLVKLDDTILLADKNQYFYKVCTLQAEIARLNAERDFLNEVVFPVELLEHKDDPEISMMITNQEKLFRAKKSAIDSQISYTEKSTLQLLERKNAILPQIETTEKVIEINRNQVQTYKKLLAAGNANKVHLQEFETKQAESQGRKGQLLSSLAEVEHSIIQSEINLEKYKNEVFEKVANELKTAQNELSVSQEQLKNISERLKRTTIVAPEAGQVSALNDGLTPRGVLPQQQPLMEIIPQDDKLVVEAKVLAQDIASVKLGQISRVRLNAYRARVVPVLEGKVVSLSPDIVMPDPREAQHGQQPYYKARIEIDEKSFKEISEMKDVHLYPGMAVDVMIVTGTRTLMKYILDPITISVNKSFREK